MGGVAQLASAAGHEVSGSDANVYPPMDAQLRSAGITLTEGYSADNLKHEPDLVIVGNAMSRGNVEVEALLNSRISYTSGAQWLSDYFLRDRWVVAVAGTHGKTTTSSMVAWILEYAGLNPGFLVGGVPANFGVSARAGDAPFFVVEADEYDTAFFDKRSKFVHYRPDTAVLNNLEFDHADIFNNLDEIKRQFHHLVRTIPARGKLIINADDARLADVIAQGCWSECEWFSVDATDTGGSLVSAAGDSIGSKPQWRYQPAPQRICERGGDEFALQNIIGAHNLANATAAIAAARHAGVPVQVGAEAMRHFAGVKRRLECIGTVNGISVYDDFAHHPTAIAATLAALKPMLKGGKRLIALVDFRSNSMASGTHLAQMPVALTDASVAMLFNARPDKLDLTPLLRDAAEDDPTVIAFNEIPELLEQLNRVVMSGDIVVCMSNGSFGGIHGQILTMLNKTAAS